MDQEEPLLKVKSVRLSYPLRTGLFKWKQYTPLRDISFDLGRGETVGIVGRNGAGKSTLLRVIAGLIEPDRGTVITTNGARVSLLSLGVGFVPHLSGRENAILNGMLLGLSHKEIASKMSAVIAFSELETFIDQPLYTYSSGMKARLGFSVSIQVSPDILLIDEVLGVGDEQFRQKSTKEMKRLIKSDKSVILTSHNLSTLQELCDRVIWLEGGVIRFIGNAADGLSLYTSSTNK